MADTAELHPTDFAPAVVPLADARELFAPRPGHLYFDTGDNPREYPNYDLHIGSYVSERASHRTGIYRPHDFMPGDPVVVLGVPWLVGNRGHIHGVADGFASEGTAVLVKGTPRYAGPNAKILTFAEDANEIHGLIREVERTQMLGKLGRLRWYGESQAAGKLYAGLAIASRYDRDTVSALAVGPCPDEALTRADAPRLLLQLLSEGMDIPLLVRQLGWDGIKKLRGTFSLKDLHHHALVSPILGSGEPGEIVPYIPRELRWRVLFGGKDSQSQPREAAARLETTLPNVTTRIVPRLGHLSVIKSEEAAEERRQLVSAA